MTEPVSEERKVGDEQTQQDAVPSAMDEGTLSLLADTGAHVVPEVAAATAPESAPEAAPSMPDTVGKVLREARLGRGLTIVDVTQAIKFGARQIEALERDELDRLPGTTFVRGVVRSYGKFLRLDEDSLLALLGEQQTPVISEVQAPEDTGAKITLHNNRRSVLPWLALAVAVVAVGVAVATYFEWPAGDKPKAGAGPRLQAPSARVEQAAALDARTAQLSPEALASAASDARQLVFVFDAKAWVEVKDATQKIIFAQNNDTGTRQVVQGKPPFDLVVGNASAVHVQYEDKVVDLRPYTKVDVARLTLP